MITRKTAMSWPLDSLVGFQYQRATDQAMHACKQSFRLHI